MFVLFYVLAGIILASAVGVVAFRDPIYSALCLVVNLLAVAGIYAMLDAHFLMAVQIIVYAGAIVVLVLFVLMLLNLEHEAQKVRGPVWITLSVVSGVGFMYVLLPLIAESFPEMVGGGEVEGTVAAVGRLLFTDYVFPFEAASILIMAALVGAVMLAKRRRGDEALLGEDRT